MNSKLLRLACIAWTLGGLTLLLYRHLAEKVPVEEPDLAVRKVSPEELWRVMSMDFPTSERVKESADKRTLTNGLVINLYSFYSLEYGNYRCLKNGTWIQLNTKPPLDAQGRPVRGTNRVLEYRDSLR